MATTREDLVTRLNTLRDRASLVRVATGDRSKQWDPAANEREILRIQAEIDAIDAVTREPMIRQIRVTSSRGY